MAVFSRGIEKGFRGHVPIGGHEHPVSGDGANLLWKKAQKNALKNITSDVINRIIPHSSPRCTFLVWLPHIAASRVTSRHQHIMLAAIRSAGIGRVIVMFIWNQ